MSASLSDIVAQNTAGHSAGNPVGVPTSYSWYDGLLKVSDAPPSDFTAVTGWGQVYQKAGAPAYSNPNASVEIANATTYVHLKSTGQWVVAQAQATDPITGAHFVSDFSGNAAIPMSVNAGSNGSTALDTPPSGHNDHFWPSARGTYAAGDVDGVYVQMDMRVTDPNLQLIANVGADWWRNASAGYVDGFSNNPAAGMSNWVQLSTQWSTLGFFSGSTAQFEAHLPPTLVGSAQGNPPPPVVVPPPVNPPPPVATPAATPTINSFTDSGIVGDGITNAASLKLAGTATAGSTVSVFDGATKIGTAAANASGAWSLTTGHLSDATHSFTAKATNASGNTSQASSVLKVTVDTVAPATPKIASFSPDSGTAGDGITNANHLTLVGTAEAGSSIKMFDGTTEIGTAKANASGAWNFSTAQLPNGTHAFTAKATDAAGNTSSTSSQLSVKVDTGLSPPVSGKNLLVNGSFEASPVAANHWEGFSSIPGWTALTGGTIELWNNLNNVKATDGVNFGELDFLGARDGFYQKVKTVAGQSYDLSFDARSRPGSTSATTTIEVLWNGSMVATVPPGDAWKTYNFAVTGTGGADRLTFREAKGQSADGLGGLYDNVSLVAAKSGSSAQPQGVTTQALGVNETDRAMSLVTQFSAASVANPGAGVGGVLHQADTSATLAQTLAQSQHRV
jgi:hypothetical protein